MLQTSLRSSPFKVVYGCDPLAVRAYVPGDARLLVVHSHLIERDKFLTEIKDQLEQVH
jgi:hypothetical protein